MDDASTRTKRTLLRRRPLIVAASTLVVLAAGGGLAAYVANGSAADTRATQGPPTSTATIERGELRGATNASGSLGYGSAVTVATRTAGTVTELPGPGTRIPLGEQLFSVDNRPTRLLHGVLPAWRAFESGMDDGPDVLALEESLAALGHFDRAPDTHFDGATREAIRGWQEATGQERTGTLPLGSVVFSPGEARVAEIVAAVGDQAAPGSPMIELTGTARIVAVELKPAAQQLAQVGAQVRVELPGAVATTGTVTAVGVPTQKDGSSGDLAVPVTIALDDPEAAGALQQAPVTVAFPAESREDVLSVPVGALLALDDETFGLEVVGKDGSTTRVAVVTGLFAGGRVEVSGDGIAEGQKVVVPRA